ncbi:MAG TPA: hypothetical protein VFO56_01105 [Gaiellaceae bacterium]|nr:hypothetical protein [Gaiellaceae bacterium]
MRSLVRVLVVALGAFVAAGCGGGSSETSAKPASAAAGAPSGREPAPAIAGTSLDGEPISLSDSRGRAVLVNVWSSW